MLSLGCVCVLGHYKICLVETDLQNNQIAMETLGVLFKVSIHDKLTKFMWQVHCQRHTLKERPRTG